MDLAIFKKSVIYGSSLIVGTEGILGSDLTYGEAAGSAENSEAGKISLVCLREEDIPGASLNGRQPSQLHVVELKRWLKGCYNCWEEGRSC